MQALSHRFNTYRYVVGQQFRPHLDGDRRYCVNPKTHHLEYWKTGRSMLSMLLYLNGQKEGVEGGDTLLLEVRVVERVAAAWTGIIFQGMYPSRQFFTLVMS